MHLPALPPQVRVDEAHALVERAHEQLAQQQGDRLMRSMELAAQAEAKEQRKLDDLTHQLEDAHAQEPIRLEELRAALLQVCFAVRAVSCYCRPVRLP